MLGRMVAQKVKPRLIIAEIDGKWTLRTETTLKNMSIEFIPNEEYDELTGDGRQLKVIHSDWFHSHDEHVIASGSRSVRKR